MASQLWQRLRQARKYADLSQQSLAELCHVSRGAVALWEAADPEHRTRPTAEHCLAIARACKVPIDWLLNDSSDLDAVWRIAAERGGDDPVASGGSPDVLPDLRQNGKLFLFAQTPDQLARKARQASRETPGTAHLILIGQRAVVHSVATPADALAAVVEILTRT